MASAPTITDTLKVQSPTFIRKLGRPSHWGHAGVPFLERVQLAVNKVFRNQLEPEISVYLVSTDDDLRRVAVGYNAGRRGSLHETIAFLPILKPEIENLGIQISKTPANLNCDYANQLHYDLLATDLQLEQLCTNLINANRLAAKCSESSMKKAVELTREEKCKSVPDNIECNVSHCNFGSSG